MTLNFDPRPPGRRIENEDQPPAPLKPRRTVDDQARLVRRVGVVLLGIVIAALLWVVSSNDDNGSGNAETSTTRLEAARDAAVLPSYPYFELEDDGHTLIVDGEGDEDAGAGIGDIAELLNALEVPGSVTAQMDNTRALDGMQEASWDGLTATWTYHPDNGLDIIITDR